MRVQKVKFSEIDNFSFLHEYISKPINRNNIKLPSACFPFNSEQKKVLLQFIDGIFVMYSIPEGNSVTFIGKIAWGQTGSMFLIDIG